MRQGDQQAERDKAFMAVALDLARLGEGRTSPNPMVGAVIVKKRQIIARGFHRGPGQAHAEIEALTSPPAPLLNKERVAAARRTGEVLYITLEPCCPPKDGGRTPPCTDAILKSGIREVVIAMRDPDPRVSGHGIRILKKAGVKVRVGVLEKEARELNVAYVIQRTENRPMVILKMAATADGKVGLRGRPVKITGPEADAQSHALRDRVDAILVGIGTVLNDDPRLTTRLKGRKGRDPIRIVLDRRLRIPLKARVLNLRSKSPTWIATDVSSKHSPKHPKMARLKKMGVEFLPTRLPLVLKELARRGVMSLLVEGGPRVWESFLSKRLVDRMMLFFSPKELGPRGVPVLSHPFKHPGFKTASVRRMGPDLMIEASF